MTRPPPIRIRLAILLLMPFSALVGNVIAAPFSIVLLPDTQYYAANPVYGLYNAQAQWIVANKETQAIAFVIHLGDMTNANLDSEWSVVRAAHDLLDTADIPCSVIPGNHDYYGVGATRWHEVFRRDLTKYNKNFGPRSFSGKSWYGGNMGNTADQNENNYCFFSSDGLDFMVVSLEYAPRKDTLTWANQLIGRHPKHRVILVTHAYLTHNGAYTNGAGPEYGIIGSGGTDLWNECASRHSNVFLVVCGHVGESAVNEKKGVAGNTLYEMVVDYQFEKKLNNTPNLGNGWLRILTLHPDAHRIDATPLTVASGDSTIFVDGIDRFYEPDYDPSPTHSDHTFSLHYNMGDMGVYCYMNASTGFHDREVNPIVTGNQRNPDIGQSAAGDWAAVWEDDSEGNGMFTIHVRGFDADGNERFPDTVVNTFGGNTTSATNPSLAMCPDGRFVVAFQSGSTDIRVRTHAADGTPMDSVDWPVVSTATGTVRNPDVAMDERGNFIVVWEDDSDGNGSYQVRARGFGWDGTERFPAKTVNTISAGQQINPVIAMAPNGDYVVAWDDDQENDDSFEIGARGFYTNEQEMFAQMFANNTTVGQQRNPDVAMDASGRCLVIWEDDADMNGVYQIKARGFSADGSQLLPEMTVNLLAAGNQINPAVTMDASGNWFAVWEDNRVGEGYQIVSQVFSLSGERVFSADVQVNTVSTVKYGSENPRRQDPVISIHRSGRYVVAWADDMDGDGSFEILARGVTGTARSLAIKSIHGSVGRTLSDVFYKEGESVLLNATPDAGFHFIRWQGDCPPGAEYNNPLILVVDSNKVLEAVFAPCKGLSWCFY